MGNDKLSFSRETVLFSEGPLSEVLLYICNIDIMQVHLPLNVVYSGISPTNAVTAHLVELILQV